MKRHGDTFATSVERRSRRKLYLFWLAYLHLIQVHLTHDYPITRNTSIRTLKHHINRRNITSKKPPFTSFAQVYRFLSSTPSNTSQALSGSSARLASVTPRETAVKQISLHVVPLDPKTLPFLSTSCSNLPYTHFRTPLLFVTVQLAAIKALRPESEETEPT